MSSANLFTVAFASTSIAGARGIRTTGRRWSTGRALHDYVMGTSLNPRCRELRLEAVLRGAAGPHRLGRARPVAGGEAVRAPRHGDDADARGVRAPGSGTSRTTSTTRRRSSRPGTSSTRTSAGCCAGAISCGCRSRTRCRRSTWSITLTTCPRGRSRASSPCSLAGYAISRGANAQKHAFRRDPAAPLKWWGGAPRFVATRRGPPLLASGFWGVGRHLNYLGDLMMGLAWCAPVRIRPLPAVLLRRLPGRAARAPRAPRPREVRGDVRTGLGGVLRQGEVAHRSRALLSDGSIPEEGGSVARTRIAETEGSAARSRDERRRGRPDAGSLQRRWRRSTRSTTRVPTGAGPSARAISTAPVVTCPWHGWRYDVTTGVRDGNPTVRVACYPVTIEDGVGVRRSLSAPGCPRAAARSRWRAGPTRPYTGGGSRRRQRAGGTSSGGRRST